MLAVSSLPCRHRSVRPSAAIIDTLDARTILHNVFTFVLMTIVLLYVSPLLEVSLFYRCGLCCQFTIPVVRILLYFDISFYSIFIVYNVYYVLF